MTNNLSQEIRQRVSLTDILSRYGFQPDHRGYINCPFHPGDRNASLRIYKDNTWHCFGCHKYGSVIDFVMEMERVPFIEAVRIIDKDFGLGLFEQKPDLRRQRTWQQEKARREQEEQRRKKERLELIEKRRGLWQQFMALAVNDHDSAQQRAELLAEVEHIDYLIEKAGDTA